MCLLDPIPTRLLNAAYMRSTDAGAPRRLGRARPEQLIQEAPASAVSFRCRVASLL